jgi:hypothetical protein
MNFLLIGKDSAERVETAVVSANFFDVLGVKPLLGRTFVAADEAHGGPAVLILSHKYWQVLMGGDPRIIGKVFQMNNRSHTVIGVRPPFRSIRSRAMFTCRRHSVRRVLAPGSSRIPTRAW